MYCVYSCFQRWFRKNAADKNEISTRQSSSKLTFIANALTLRTHTHNADAIICYRILSDVGITLNSMLVYFFHFLSMNSLVLLSAYDAYDRFNQCLQINYAGYFQLSSSRSLCFVSFSFTLCRAFSQFLSSRFLLSVFSLLGATRTVKVSHSTSLTVIHRK